MNGGALACDIVGILETIGKPLGQGFTYVQMLDNSIDGNLPDIHSDDFAL